MSKGEENKTPKKVWLTALAAWPAVGLLMQSSVHRDLTADPYALDPGHIGAFLVATLRGTPCAIAVGAMIIIGYRHRDKLKELPAIFLALAIAAWAIASFGSLSTCTSSGPYNEPSRR